MTSLLPAILLAGILPFTGNNQPEPFPVEAHGDINFQLDAARFDSSASDPLEIYLSIPQAALTESRDSTGFAHVRTRVGLENSDGDEIASASEMSWIPLLPLSSGDAVLSPRHLMTLRPKMSVRASQIRVRIEDLEGRKRGLFDRIRSRNRSGEAHGRFEGEPGRCGLSDIALVWDVDRSQQNGQLPIRRRLRPNPLRYYGLYHTTLLFYVEGFGDFADIGYRIRSVETKQTVASGSDSARASPQGVRGWLESLDISSLASGAYRIEVSRGVSDSCLSVGTFQVLWDNASWNQNRQALLEEAYVLLGTSEYEKVQSMARGEVESYMRNLWARHDPDPSTGRNELRDEYLSRADHANRFFGTTFHKGMLTDRGRVYVRYGSPDEITKELNPQDKNVLARVLPGEVESDGIDIIKKPVPLETRDDRAYEIWTYQVRGQPLFPEQEIPVQRTGLKFIFIDDLGYGDMRLVYTNISGGF
jgi:GWxTD domain-containing protein